MEYSTDSPPMTRSDFNELVSMLSGKLFGHAYRILRNQEEAEDAVQEAFLKIWKLGGKLDKYISIEALALTMTRNYCLDQLRKRRYDNNDEEHFRNNQLLSAAPSPQDQLEQKETSEILKVIIENLPYNYRIIITLREIEELSYEEIAEITNMRINALRVSLSRARKIIRDEFIKHNDENRRT
jgi:RNA polymerase sigma-70 factor (ECF subfamily)